MSRQTAKHTKGVMCCAVILLLLMVTFPVAAQSSYRVTVEFESVFIRSAPALTAEPSGSVYANNVLEAIGRNLDGTWFQVRRPGRMTPAGWILAEMVDWDFQPETLPLTDFSTGANGPTPLTSAPPLAVFVRENVVLREQPLLNAARIMTVLHSTTIPVVARNQDGSWLRVNYLGYEGWVIALGARRPANILEAPQAPDLPPLEGVQVIVIPPEIQLEQLNRLREYVLASRDLAVGLQGFWSSVNQGEIMPCEAPPFVLAYPYSQQDVRELPELQRYAPQLTGGIFYLNLSVELLTVCGAFDRRTVQQARNNAINAGVIFNATLERLDDLERNVIR